MYKRSVRRAYFGTSPHMWPFVAWRLLITGAFVVVFGAFGIAYVAGEDFNLFGWLLVSVFYGLWVAFFLLVPAALLALLDLILVRRPRHRPAKFDAKPKGPDRQSVVAWSGFAGAVSTAFGLAYLVVYLNAFAPSESYLRLVDDNLIRFAVAGVGAGAVVAWMMNVAHDERRAGSAAEQERRGALLWAFVTFGFAAALMYFDESTLERTLLPGSLLAVIGAAVIPHLAVTPPTDLSHMPPPRAPAAPSPGPQEDPEGGAGEGAKGDWRTAPPPKFPSETNAIRAELPATKGIAHG